MENTNKFSSSVANSSILKKRKPEIDLSQFYSNEKRQKTDLKESVKCPYLGQIRRHMLDFDFEKICSVTLSNMNVYSCLTCGKYF